MCVQFCVRVASVTGMPRRTLVFIDLEQSPDHLEVLVDASLFRRNGLTSDGAHAVDTALADVDPRLTLRTASTCTEHAGHAAAV